LVSNDLPDSINSIVMSYTIFDITDYNNEDLAHHNMGME
jgi:cytochrome c oxidase assembly protein subunit 11